MEDKVPQRICSEYVRAWYEAYCLSVHRARAYCKSVTIPGERQRKWPTLAYEHFEAKMHDAALDDIRWQHHLRRLEQFACLFGVNFPELVDAPDS